MPREAAASGRTLKQADPIRLFILFIADIIIRLLNKINDTGKQNLYKYSRGDNLDNLAANAWITRIPASAATTTMQVTLSGERSAETVIPAGTRISPESNIYFATDTALIIPAGETTGTVAATCLTVGTAGNNYNAGEIDQVVDPVPYVASMVNLTKSEGGADAESDDALRERIWEAPEALSAAGPEGAYKAKTKAINEAIDKLIEQNPFEVPNARVADLIKWSINRNVQDPKDAVEPTEEQMKTMGPEAIREIKKHRILEFVANKEKIRPAQAQVDARLQEMAKAYHIEFDDLKSHFRQSGRINQLREELRFQMAADFIVGIRPAAEESK
jgi:hypothetical protein